VSPKEPATARSRSGTEGPIFFFNPTGTDGTANAVLFLVQYGC
jgi:hypothetical protein